MNANQVIAGLGLALAAVSSQAATSFFTSEAAFNAAVASFGPRTVETYEAPAPSSTATSQDFGAFTFSCAQNYPNACSFSSRKRIERSRGAKNGEAFGKFSS